MWKWLYIGYWLLKTSWFNLMLWITTPKIKTDYWTYLKTVNRHRWYVFQEARRLGIPFLGLIHDWSKYLPSEFIPYAKYFNGGYVRGEQPENVKLAFDFAWLHHQRWNKHHWQSYVLHNDVAECPKWEVKSVDWGIRGDRESIFDIDGQPAFFSTPFDSFNLVFELAKEMSRLPKTLPMPDRYRKEMLADWRGAGRAYGNADTKGWYLKNKAGIILHEETREWVERELGIIIEFVGMDHQEETIR